MFQKKDTKLVGTVVSYYTDVGKKVGIDHPGSAALTSPRPRPKLPRIVDLYFGSGCRGIVRFCLRVFPMLSYTGS